MGDFIDAIGRGIGGLVGGALDVIGQIFISVFGFLSPVIPEPMIPWVVGGVLLLLAVIFLLRR